MPLKMLKSVKKLKFWSSKKRKRSSNVYEPYYFYSPVPAQPPQCHHYHCYSCSHSSYSPTVSSTQQPSAPPLPPWLEAEQIVSPASQHGQEQNDKQREETKIVVASSSSITSTYQQYMVENPVYEQVVAERPRKERRGVGFFGCVVQFGIHIISCVCPCLTITQLN
ncbi:hypothetical protein ACFE04_022876 [Oxalis oulophora]